MTRGGKEISRGRRPSRRRRIRANPLRGSYLTNLGIVLVEAGRWKEAKTVLERTIVELPDLPEGWLNLGIFREIYLGDVPGALSCYERYGKLNGGRKDEVSKWAEWLRKSSSPR